MPYLEILDLRGGVNDNHPATIGDTQVAEAWDVDYWEGTLGGRRNGCASAKTGLAQPNWLGVHTPTSDPADDRLWMFNGSQAFKFYNDAYAETTPSVSPADLFLGIDVSAASLHGKFFFAVQSTTSGGTPLNRLHVYDGTEIRRVGLAQTTTAPTVADQGAGSYLTTRYFRTRWARVSGSVTLLRSEPSDVTTFVPSGTGASARISRPTLINEGETHWEVEESIDNANFYRIAQVAVGTANYDDSLASTAVATTGTLSEDIGRYVVPRSARLVLADEDRLLTFGDYEEDAYDSRVSWTPVGAATGVGNDERIPDGNYLDLDAQLGGGITAAALYESKAIVFKRQTIYGLSRTGAAEAAYLPSLYSKAHGALKDSVQPGTDAQGRPVVFFWDPAVGPAIFSAEGVKEIGVNIQAVVKRVNHDAAIVCRSVYHAQKRQMWWFLALDAATEPDTKVVYDAQTGGFVFHTVPGDSVTAAAEWNEQPHLGVQKAAFATHAILRADESGAQDDAGKTFRAYILTKAYRLGNLMRRFGVNAGVIEGYALTGVSIAARLVRNYGAENSTFRTASLQPTEGTGDYVVTPIDDLAVSECTAVQVEFGDESARSVTPWVLNALVLRYKLEGENG